MYSLGATLVRPGGDVVTALVRKTNLNRDGSGSGAAAVNEIKNFEVQYSRSLWRGQIGVGLGYDDASSVAASDSDVRGFVSWRQPL